MTPRTLVVETGAIYKFAQDRDTIAWVGPRYRIHVRRLSNRAGWIVGTAAPQRRAGFRTGPAAFVLGGTRAAWMSFAGATSREAAIWTGAPGDRRPALIDAISHGTLSGTGGYFGGLAADGTTVVYGWADEACEPVGSCSRFVLKGGGVARVAGRKPSPRRIPRVPPPFTVAASQGRVAVVPAASSVSGEPLPQAALNGPVHVYDLAGRELTQVDPAGTVRDVALSWPGLAVLVKRSDGGTVIERYDARSGELLAASAVAGASDLAIGSGGIVFLDGSEIYTLRAGRPALVWPSTGRPSGLSIEGRRVAWAVNLNGRGRIRALDLPR